MPVTEFVVSCAVHDSFRVQQVAGLFDLPWSERATERIEVELPAADEAWQVGLITGPSGSGKSTVARGWLGEPARQGGWSEDRAVVDGFGELPIRTITGWLTAVGLGSVPAWVRPYGALSTGERFRCDMARALAEGEARRAAGEVRATVVVDEFTSVVDRTVARALSVAVGRAVRRNPEGCRLVAISCHDDVADWLEPDWVLDLGARRLERRRLRRPAVELSVCESGRTAWPMFRRHHYLSGALNPAARCFVAWWGEQPVTFCATLAQMGRRGMWRVSRWVTLPEFQGMGLGTRVLAAVAQWHVARGLRLRMTASHPAVVAHCTRSAAWRLVGVRRARSDSGRGLRGYRGAVGRSVASFEFVGECGTGEQGGSGTGELFGG